MMAITALDLVAITIAMASSITVMILFWRQNMALQRDNMNLRRLLRVEREKNVTPCAWSKVGYTYTPDYTPDMERYL